MPVGQLGRRRRASPDAVTRAATPAVRRASLITAAALVSVLPLVAGGVPAAAEPAGATGGAALTGPASATAAPAPAVDLPAADPAGTVPLAVPEPVQSGAAQAPSETASTAAPQPPTTASPNRTRGPDARPRQRALPAPDTRGGIRVSTNEILLTDEYWTNRGAVAELAMTVSNTGRVAERVHLTYTLPADLRDAGTHGCAATDGTFRCPPRRLEAGASSTFRTRVRVTADAWRRMPLSGKVSVTANASSDEQGTVRTERFFAVLFPAGPPTPGMALSAGEVDLLPGSPGNGQLDVRLGNTGSTDALGAVKATLPNGFRITTMPDGCRQDARAELRCDFGRVPAGQSRTVRLPVNANANARARVPLAGVVVGILDPVDGPPREMRTSFRVLAADQPAAPLTAESGRPADAAVRTAAGQPAADPVAVPTRGWSQRIDPVTIIAVAVGICVVALLLATVSLRRRLGDDPALRRRRTATRGR